VADTFSETWTYRAAPIWEEDAVHGALSCRKSLQRIMLVKQLFRPTLSDREEYSSDYFLPSAERRP